MSLMERRGSRLREICTATASEDAYRPEFMPRFETGKNWFTVTLYNMNYVEADTVGTQVGTPSCNTMPGISASPSTRKLADDIEGMTRSVVMPMAI